VRLGPQARRADLCRLPLKIRR